MAKYALLEACAKGCAAKAPKDRVNTVSFKRERYHLVDFLQAVQTHAKRVEGLIVGEEARVRSCA